MFIKYVLIICLAKLLHAQKNTLKFPSDCESDCIFKIEWKRLDLFTNFTITTRLVDALDVNSAWCGIAFSIDEWMGEDNSVILSYANGTPILKHYYNPPDMAKPVILFDKYASVGLKLLYFHVSGRTFQYAFLRTNQLDIKNYLPFNAPYNVLVAQGSVEDDDIVYHVFRNHTTSPIEFS